MPATAIAPAATQPAEDDVWEMDYSNSPPLADSQSILQAIQAAAPECILPSGYFAHPCVQAAAVRDTNAGDMRATFTFVTRPKKNEPNRAGRMIQIVPGQFGGGIQTENYQANPIVLFNHGMDGFAFPIGVSEDPKGKFTGKYTKQYASADVYFNQSCPYAEDVFRMVQSGILRAASIGFNALKVVPMRWDDNSQLPPGVENVQRYGYDVTESDQLEWSVVAAGADAGALRQCLETGKIGGKTYRPLMTQFFQRYAEPKQAWTPGWGPGQISQVGQREGVAASQSVTTISETRSSLEENGLRQLFSEFATTITTAIQTAVATVSGPSPLVENGIDNSLPNSQSNLAATSAIATISTQQCNSSPAPSVASPAAMQQEIQTTLQKQISAMVSRAVTDAVTPVVVAQNGIVQRLDHLTGKIAN